MTCSFSDLLTPSSDYSHGYVVAIYCSTHSLNTLSHVSLIILIPTTQELDWEDPDDEPSQVFAGNGNSFILTRYGCLYSFGTGKFGMLGHGEERSSQVPRQILALRRAPVEQGDPIPNPYP